MQAIVESEKRILINPKESQAKRSASFTSGLHNLQISTNTTEGAIPEDIEVDNPEIIQMADPNANLNTAECYLKIERLLATSKHYTPRDKQEITAQRPIWNGINAMISAKTNDGTAHEVLVASGVAAKKQMVLYALVGEYGWDTAIRTIKNTEATAIGLPAPVMSNVTIVKSERIYNGYSRNTYGNGRGVPSFQQGHTRPYRGGRRP